MGGKNRYRLNEFERTIHCTSPDNLVPEYSSFTSSIMPKSSNKKTKYKPFTPGSNLNIVWQSKENSTPSVDGDSQKNGDDFSMIESKSPSYTDRSVTSYENNEAEK